VAADRQCPHHLVLTLTHTFGNFLHICKRAVTADRIPKKEEIVFFVTHDRQAVRGEDFQRLVRATRQKVFLNKPIAVGFCILEISKTDNVQKFIIHTLRGTL